MNCAELAEILNERDSGGLKPSEKAAVAAHLASCPDCSRQMQAQRQLRVFRTEVPSVPRALRIAVRNMAKSHDESAAPHHSRRPFILSGLIVLGAAAAMWAVSYQRDVSPSATGSAEPVTMQEALVADDSSSASAQGGGADALGLGPGRPDPVQAASGPDSDGPRAMLAALPLAHRNQDPAAMADLDRLFETVLRELDAHPRITVLRADTQLENGGSPTELNALARRLGANAALIASNERTAGVATVGASGSVDRLISIELYQSPAFPGIGGQRTFANGWNSRAANAANAQAELASQIVGAITSSLVREPFAAVSWTSEPRFEVLAQDVRSIGYALAQFTASNPGIAERMQAVQDYDIDTLVDGSAPPEEFDAAIDAVIELVRTANDPAVRSYLWQRLENWRLLTGTASSRVVVPLWDAVLYDADAGVRMAALDALAAHREAGGVDDLLRSLDNYDVPSALRERAARHLRTPEEHQRIVVERLLSTQLTDAQRLGPLLASGSGVYLGSAAGQFRQLLELPQDGRIDAALVELAARASEPAARLSLIPYLAGIDIPEAPDTLIGFLREDASADVRRDAIGALADHRDLARARAALEQASLDDPDMSVRTEARRVLSGR